MKRTLTFLLTMMMLANLSGCQNPGKNTIRSHPHPSDIVIAPPAPTQSADHSSGAEHSYPNGGAVTPALSPGSSADIQTFGPSECDPPVLPEPENEEFVLISDYIPSAKIKLAYATVNNFTGLRIYDFTDAYLRYGTVKKLMKITASLEKEGVGLIFWDAFRPISAQEKLYECYPDPTFVSHPVTGKRAHSRGNTVDVTLFDLKSGKELPMPSGFDDFTAAADRDYSECSSEVAKNARLLEDTFKEYGFTPYYNEWWHFSDSTDYPVDEDFEPTVPKIWVANCNEFINLRNYPGGKTLARIPKGEAFEMKSWEEQHALVTYRGITGYVHTAYIKPADPGYFGNALKIVAPTDVYSYEQMLSDLNALQKQYPDTVILTAIGKSELGRTIPVLQIGNPDAEHHVLLHGAIHAREHMTTWLLMAMADYWLAHDLTGYGDVCYHIVPMVNPDGVVISQTGKLTAEQQKIYRYDRIYGYDETDSDYSYTELWKANGKGVDINRNFPCGWENFDERTSPSSQEYRGTAPFSSAEAAALRDYTMKYSFDATVSYHASGSLIYYEYGDNKQAIAESKSLAGAISAISGYTIEKKSGLYDAYGGGYKDWAIEELGIPSVTVEIGCGEAPLTEREIYSIFVRNYCIFPQLARWLQK